MKKIHARQLTIKNSYNEFYNKKKFLPLKNPPPPVTFLMIRPLHWTRYSHSKTPKFTKNYIDDQIVPVPSGTFCEMSLSDDERGETSAVRRLAAQLPRRTETYSTGWYVRKNKTKSNFAFRVLRNRKLPLCNSISNHQFTLPRFLSVAYDDTHNFGISN